MTTDRDSSGASRRTFLTGAGLSGLAVGTSVLAPSDAEAAEAVASASAAPPPVVRYALDLDGAPAGVPSKASGGTLEGVPYSQARPSSEIRDKYLVGVKVTDVVVASGTGLSAAYYAALASFSTGGRKLHDGRITRRDDAGRLFHYTEFYNARVTSLQLPAVEVNTTTAAQMVVGLRPENARAGSAGVAQAPVRRPAWTTGRFALSIDGITTRAAKVGSMLLKRNVIEPTFPGDEVVFDDLEVSDLVVSFASQNAADLNAWYKSYLIDGNRVGTERNGRLTYLGSDGSPLFALTLSGLGLYRLAPATSFVGAERTVRTNAVMFCESATFTAGPAARL